MRDLLEKIDKLNEGWKLDLMGVVAKYKRNPSVEALKKAEKEVTNIDSFWISDPSMIGNFYGLLAKALGLPLMFHADGLGTASLAQMNPEKPDMYLVVADGSREKDAKFAAKKQNELGALPANLVKKFGLTDKSKEKTSSDSGNKVDPGLARHIKKKDKDDSDAGDRSQGQYVKGPNLKISSGLKLGNVQKMTADDKNINDLMTAYNNILKKYGTSIRESIVKEEDPELQQRTKDMMKSGKLVTSKSPENVEADLKMLRAIRTAVRKGFKAGTLSRTHKTNKLIMKMLNDTDSYIADVKKNANYEDPTYTDDETARYAIAQRQQNAPDDEIAVVEPVKPKNDKTDAEPNDRSQGVQVTDKGAADKTGDEKTSISARLANQQITPDNLLQHTNELIKVLNQLPNKEKAPIVNFLKNQIPELGSAPKAQTQQGRTTAANKARPFDYGLDKAGQTSNVQQQVDGTVQSQDAANRASGGTFSRPFQYLSTDFNDLLRLAGTQKLTEASMNISMTGNTSSEVRELMDILKNAGMDDAMPVKDLDMFKSTDKPAPCPHCAAMHGMDSPCGETVEEEWDNSPDEQYQDDEYMMHDLSGGINRKKERAAQRVKDPAVAYESSLKNSLHGQLKEMYQTLEATTGNMSDEQANAIKDRLARLSGTHRAGKNHAQYNKFKNQKPMSLGTAKAPGTAANPGLAKAPGTAANPGMAKAPGTAANPGMAKAPGKAQAIKTAMNPITLDLASRAYPGKPPEKVITFFKNKGIPASELNDYFKMVINKQL